MLTKYQLFGILNLLISAGLMFLLSQLLIPPVPIITYTPMPFAWEDIFSYLPEAVVSIALIINLTIAYKLLTKKHLEWFRLYAIWTVSSMIWPIVTFIGYFFASSLSFLIISFLLIALAYYLIQKLSKKSAIFISILTILVVIFSIIASFEENYCWAKGDEELARTGQEWVVASKEDAAKLNKAAGLDVKTGTQIGTHFRAHFLCHRNFNFLQALKEKYLFSN